AKKRSRPTENLWSVLARVRCGETTVRTRAYRSTAYDWDGRLNLRHFLAIEADEIYRIKQKWRKATIAHGGCDDLARKRKQQPWAFDQYDRVQAFRWNVSNAKNAGKGQIKTKK